MTELAEEARTRQGLYRFTGAALRPPRHDTLGNLVSAVEVLETRDLDRFAYAREWRTLAARVCDTPDSEALQTEYVRLFGVGMRETPATPTESYYRVPKRDGGVGDFTARLQAEYRSMGLAWSGESEPPDHISTEMDAMSYLAGVEADSWAAGMADDAYQALRNQHRFLDRHLSVWVPTFVAKVRAADPPPLYSGIAEFLHSFVIHEKSIALIMLERTART